MDLALPRAYYRAALAALRFVEQRQPTGRRFGAEADAQWSSFKGDLTTADRLDLLIRDADAQWPGAFGARTVFAKEAVAEDEPFGADWPPLDPVEAEELWRAAPDVADSPAAALGRVAEIWELSLAAFDASPINPAEKLIIAGPSAIAGTILAFANGADLDWSEQVTVVATPPGHRQLAALAGGILNATKPSKIVTAAHASAPKSARLLASDDAHPDDSRRATELAGA